MARWIIPDIHGCAKTLKSLVESFLKITKEDELFFLGDFIDRGPRSKEVIDYLMDLQEKGYRLHCLKGNHEDYCIKAWEADQKWHLFKPEIQRSWEKVGASATLKSFGVKHPREIPQQYIEWMQGLEYYHELEDYILVHAGMNFNIDNPFEDLRSMIWVRNFKVDFNKTNGRRIIHGHIPVDYSFIDHVIHHQKGYDFIALDNGVFCTEQTDMGNLMAFNPDTNVLFAQTNLDM
ncbi:MAG: serine/threonine protein phosphatase [Bacteroidales bacterium]|nr:serine/threonine protein phosphatase [Bacteroidales bacterium]